jgi:VWFA-related protein
MLAVDAQSFHPGVSRGVAVAASSFVKRLLPTDRVGLYTYPLGPRVEPTNDRGEVLAGLDKVVGQKSGGDTGQFSLAPSDIVDLSAWVSGAQSHPISGDGEALGAKICGGDRPDRPRDDQCWRNLQFEGESLSRYYEAEGTQRSGQVLALIQGLSTAPGRKIVVLVSGGMIASDRPSLRPDLAEIGIDVGRQAAEANVTVYTLFIDQTWLDQYSAERRRPPPRPTNAERDRAVLSKWLEQFSGGAGGALMRVMTGSGEAAFDRIAIETSAYYILGVEPSGVDRDGKTHQINVKVGDKALTVRGRSYVKLPKK